MTAENTEQSDIQVESLNPNVIITVGGRDIAISQSSLGLTINSSEREILDAVRNVIDENITDESGEYSYTVRKATNSGNMYIYPKPVAGKI